MTTVFLPHELNAGYMLLFNDPEENLYVDRKIISIPIH